MKVVENITSLSTRRPLIFVILVALTCCGSTVAFSRAGYAFGECQGLGRTTKLPKSLTLSSFRGTGVRSTPSYHHGRSELSIARWNTKYEGATTEVFNRCRFDPLDTASHSWDEHNWRDQSIVGSKSEEIPSGVAPFATLAIVPFLLPDEAQAATKSLLSQGDFNPETFKPVCGASDGFYRFLQASTQAVVGDENFLEYGPLIAGGLLRVRLELCVVESFFNEAVGPFIDQNGLSWILPLHETVETFLAGTIFALATTFILVGSTKLISVILVYGDVFFGAPCRLFGGFFFDRARGKPVTLDLGLGPWKKRVVGPPDVEGEEDGKGSGSLANISIAQIPVVVVSGAVKYLGEASKILREGIEALDLFVGRYLVLLATGYIGLKFIHFKIIPDFPPF